MSCSNIDTCGCGHEHSAKCSFYYGDTLSCIGVVYGTDLEQALVDINTAVCALTPSGSITVVDSCDTNIDVTSAVVGQTTTYTVCLSSDITDAIDDNTTNISTLSTCVDQGVFDVTSNDGTITIVETASTGCGRSLDLSVTPPSGTPIVDGIIYNDTTAVPTSGGVGDKYLKTMKVSDYYDTSTLVENDEIRWRTTGQIYGDGSLVDTVKIELYDDTGSTLLYGESFGGFDKVNKQSWRADCSLTVGTGGEALLHIEFRANGKQNGTKANYQVNSQMVVDADVTGIDWAGLRIRTTYVHDSTSTTYNFARQLMVEVRKYLS